MIEHWTMTALLAAAAVAVLIGVVMADTHDPVAIEPDAPRANGTEVATFALG
mgnify:CR=1 FL=1